MKLLSLRALLVLRGNTLDLLCGLGVLRGEMHLMPASVSVRLRLRQKWKVNGER